MKTPVYTIRAAWWAILPTDCSPCIRAAERAAALSTATPATFTITCTALAILSFLGTYPVIASFVSATNSGAAEEVAAGRIYARNLSTLTRQVTSDWIKSLAE